MLSHPDCLLARVMKAKYYPMGDFMRSRLGSYPSYTWRSLWSAGGLLEQHTGWRVGNDATINTGNDSRLLGPDQGRVIVQNINTNYTNVADLIDATTATWKFDVLRSLFDEDLVKRILSIPLSSSAHDDEMVWRGDNTGVYFAKSGYKWLLAKDSASSSNDPTIHAPMI